jgi:hypothetical protein
MWRTLIFYNSGQEPRSGRMQINLLWRCIELR